MDKRIKDRDYIISKEFRLTEDIECKLKKLYEFVKNEKIPEKFMVLLSELERSEKTKR